MSKTIFYDPNGGRTYSPSGGTFYTPNGNFGVVSGNKAYYPAPARPAPPPVKRVASPNMSQRYPDRTFRGTPPVLNMKPNGSYDIMGKRIGRSLPGYVGAPYNPRGVNDITRTAIRLGLMGTRLHPVSRTIRMAFDVANAIDFGSAEWVKGEEGTWEETMSAAGFQQICKTMPEEDCFRYVACRKGGACMGTPDSIQCSVGCGWNGQVPTGWADGDSITLPAETGYSSFPSSGIRVENVYFGPGSAAVPAGRMTLGSLYSRWLPGRCNGQSMPRPAETLVRVRRPARAVLPSTPPFAVISEKTTTPPYRPPRCRPYARPMVEASFAGGRRPPSNGCHIMAPPAPRIRERKVFVRGRLGLAAIAKLYDATTEAKEIVDILYDNLGKKCPGAKSMSAKANCVYKNIATLNVTNSALELAKNHFEDKVYGKIYGTVGKHTGFGSMLPGTGPSRSVGPVTKR